MSVKTALRLACLPVVLLVTTATAGDPAQEVTTRAIEFLSREVPAWPEQNGCYSCHNNGDGARALIVALQQGLCVPRESLAATAEWLTQPGQWQQNGGESDYNDRRLSLVQFGAALAALSELAQSSPDPPVDPAAASAALASVAADLAPLQEDDGSWVFGAGGLIGSPVDYGRALMTVTARDILRAADSDRFRDAIARAEKWLRSAEPRTVLDSAAVVIGLAGAHDAAATESVGRRLEMLLRSQSAGGGWGPYEIARPEPFDTAVVLLALDRLPATEELLRAIAAGRQYLAAQQSRTGEWPATTRPAGVESYPQMISTTAWATLALLATDSYE